LPAVIRRAPYLPTIVVVAAAGVWGLFWLPLRFFERAGLAAGWATLAMFAVPLLLFLPVALHRVVHGKPTGVRQVLTGATMGAALALYYESLLLTEVARALILFYVTPAWGTLLEVLYMRRRITGARLLALIFGFAGLLVILNAGGSVPVPRNLGDVMALLSGIVFAAAAMRVRRAPETPVVEQCFAFFLYGGVFALILALLPVAALGPPPAWMQLQALLPWLLLMAAMFLIPVMWALLWGSRHLDPGRVGILLQMEAIVGIGSAALLAGEPFGVAEAAGGILVVSAGATEVLGRRERGV
jgi:drug/metabolite transporter (DMT)-like permease